MSAYYNEHDPFAAAWLRELIREGLIAPGEVDERDIQDVCPADLRGFRQCHFFAGIGVWSYALRSAGVPDTAEVWTGSPPCQPFSAAGQGGGFADERHLWPALHHLLGVCRPPVYFGEQVSSADGLLWLDLVQADLEAAGYACGALDLCAACVGAPHARHRLYLVSERLLDRGGAEAGAGTTALGRLRPAGAGAPGGLDDPLRDGRGAGRRDDGGDERLLAHAAGPTNGFWGAADWLLCRDGKWRAVEPGTFPLAHGAPQRVGRLRGTGNAIVAPLAEAFIRAYYFGEVSELA